MSVMHGRVLLGWYEREQALRFLLDDCVFNPPLNLAEAQALWTMYRSRVESLAPRNYSVPARIVLTGAERAHADKFRTYLQSCGSREPIEVIKIDLRELCVTQHLVAIDQADTYSAKLKDVHLWLNEALPLEHPHVDARYTSRRNGFNTEFDIDLNHGEHYLTFDQSSAQFKIGRLARHVAVMATASRMFLSAGHHRCYARCAALSDSGVPTAVVALVNSTVAAPVPRAPVDGAATTVPMFGPFGDRIALLSDFFNSDLAMPVVLRKKRYQLQVRSSLVAIDDKSS